MWSKKLPRLSAEPRFVPYLFETVGTAIFAYLLFDSLMVMRFNGPFSRIDLLSFLIPHSSKILIWSLFSLLYLKPKFAWRFPFAMLALYATSELTTNWIYVPVHLITEPGYASRLFDLRLNYYFPLSNAFFALSLILCFLFLKGRVSLKPDWSILPFAIWVGSWVLLGYNTDSTIPNPSYWIELQEFVWNVLFLVMASQMFKPKAIQIHDS